MISRSYTCGVGDKRLLHASLPDLLDRCAESYPDREAHVFWTAHDASRLLRESITYLDLAESSRHVAASLLDLELKPGDRLAVVSGDCPEWIILEYAALRCKLLLIRIASNKITAKSLMALIVNYKCKAVVVNGKADDKITALVCNMFIRREIQTSDKRKCGRVIGLKHEAGSRILTVRDLAEGGSSLDRVNDIQASVDADDVAAVLTSSDPEGRTRLLQFSHFAVINSCRSLGDIISVDEGATYYDSRSFHEAGCDHHTAVSFGITAVHLDQSSADNLDHVNAVLAEERAAIVVTSAPLLDRIHRKWSSGEHEVLPSCVRYLVVRGTYLIDEAALYSRRRQQKVVSLYSTEYTLVTAAASTTFSDGLPEYRPIPGVQMKVVNSNGVALPLEHPGKLLVRSPYASLGYLDEKSERSDGVTDWYDTGDIAMVREGDVIAIIDRSDDVIRHGSLNIYPSLVERRLRRLPEVVDAVVIGVPANATQQDVYACVRVSSGSRLTSDYFMQLCERLKVDGELDCSIKRVKIVADEHPTAAYGQLSVDSCRWTAVDRQLARFELLSWVMELSNKKQCEGD